MHLRIILIALDLILQNHLESRTELLESIIIKERSFSDYAGQFILRGLSSLTSLVIGISSDLSYNFASSNVEITGNLFYFTTSV